MSELDEKALEAATEAYTACFPDAGFVTLDGMETAIRAYLDALPSTPLEPGVAGEGVPEGGVLTKTERGFALHEFTDLYGVECRLQKSSLATDDAIWLGAKDIGLKRFVPYQGWSDVELEMDPLGVNHIANTSMHLNREQVAALLPLLQGFVETGDLAAPSHAGSREAAEPEPVAWQHRIYYDDTKTWSDWREGPVPQFDNKFEKRPLYAHPATTSGVAKCPECNATGDEWHNPGCSRDTGQQVKYGGTPLRTG